MNLFIEASFGAATCCLIADTYTNHFELTSPYEKHADANWQATIKHQLNIAEQALLQERHAPVPPSESWLDNIYVGIGPGKFTAIRYAVGFAYGLAWAIKTPLYGIPSSLALISECFSVQQPTEIEYFPAGNEQSTKYACRGKNIISVNPALSDKMIDNNHSAQQSNGDKLSIDGTKHLPDARHLATAIAWQYQAKPLAELLYSGKSNQHIQPLSSVMSYGASNHWVALTDQNSAFED